MRREGKLFLIAFVIQSAVFVLLFQWFVVSGHLPEAASRYPVYVGDSISYFTLSQNLLQHGVYSVSASAPFIPESFRLPGYPFFLYFFQLLGFPIVLIIFLQMALGSGTVVLTYLLGKKFLSERAAYLAALLLCIEPTSVFFSTFVMSDTLFVFSVMLGIYLLLGRRPDFTKDLWCLFAGGAVFGFAVLVRALALYLPPFLVVAYAALHWRDLRPFSKSAARLGAAALGLLLVVAPWSLRNHAQFGVYDISSTPYINFTQFNLPLFYAYRYNVSLDAAHKVFADPLPSSTEPAVESSLANKPLFQKMMRDTLRDNLPQYLYFHAIKTLPFFVTDGVRDMNRITGLIPIPPDQTNFSDLVLQKNIGGVIHYFASPNPNLWMLLAGSIPWILITALWLFELLYVFIKRPPIFRFVCIASCIILYFALLTGPVTEHRYRMPAAPFMLLLAAQGALTLRHLLNAKSGAANQPVSR